MRLQSAVVCGHCERRIEGGATSSSHQCHNPLNLALRKDGFAGTGRAAFSTRRRFRRYERLAYEKMATPERDKPRSLRNDGFAGTKVSPYERMASLERDKPRSLRKDGFAGTNVSPHEKMATPERDKPRSLRNDGFAGTKVSPYEKMASPVQTSQ